MRREKTFYVFGRSTSHWTAVVRARSKKEAVEKVLGGDWDEIEDDELWPVLTAMGAEEAKDSTQDEDARSSARGAESPPQPAPQRLPADRKSVRCLGGDDAG